jgi:hypothetical protein
MTETDHRIDASQIEESLLMLEQYVASEKLAPLAAVLRELAEKPHDDALLARLSEAFESLGVLQGAVLTYAPLITGLLSDDPFAD